jgi:hypothetical protein
MMKAEFKSAPTIKKCFNISELLDETKDPLRISDIGKALNFNRSTFFDIEGIPAFAVP